MGYNSHVRSPLYFWYASWRTVRRFRARGGFNGLATAQSPVYRLRNAGTGRSECCRRSACHMGGPDAGLEDRFLDGGSGHGADIHNGYAFVPSVAADRSASPLKELGALKPTDPDDVCRRFQSALRACLPYTALSPRR